MNIADYQAKRYSAQPCWELVVDVLQTEAGRALPVDYRSINRSIRQMADAFRIEIHKAAHGYTQVETPQDFTIILLGSARLGIHHCGIWVDGRVLHAQPAVTLYEELSALTGRFEVIEFWDRL